MRNVSCAETLCVQLFSEKRIRHEDLACWSRVGATQWYICSDFTAHWQRQNIVNPAFEEARQSQVESLADLVHLDRMDRVTSVGGYPKMELL